MTAKMAASMTNFKLLLLATLISISSVLGKPSQLPLVINTWPFTNATEKAWDVMVRGSGKASDAVVAGCRECQEQRCDGAVGYGGHPDEIGETTLDAMIMDGDTAEVGAVGQLRRVKDAIGVAKAIMDYTDHTLLVGESATKFALEMGFKEETLATNESIQTWKTWKSNNCQPNFRKNVSPDPKTSCGPYKPNQILTAFDSQKASAEIRGRNHDTIGMVVVDARGSIAAGTSTNGLGYKIHGRVGDSPIMGAGAYASSSLGGAAATGNGDIMMRFLPSFHAVVLLGHGYNVTQAAQAAMAPVSRAYPSFSGALILADSNGNFGAACHNVQGGFHYSVANPTTNKVTVYVTPCTSA